MFNAKRLLAAAVAALVCAAVVPAASAAQPPGDLLRKARQATKAFRDIDAAKKAGYEKSSECEDDPKYGGMGFHYANPELVADGRLDIERPEVLVYQPKRNGKLRLGAIEYFQVDADQDLATDPDRPSLFGMPFDGPMLGHNPQMPIHYDLHVWLYRHNPAGTFAMWNPRVKCP
jgi:opacity protein-like surface antigen